MSARIDKKTMDTLSHTNHLVDELREAVSSANEALFESRQQLERQQKIVARVHRSLLPSPVKCDHVDVDVRYLPVDTVGGDYCQVRFPTPTCCYITMCDISGEGIAPALLATRVSSEVRHCIMDGMSPHEIVRSLNSFVYEYFRDTGMLVTFIAARIDLQQKTVTHSSAGHPGALLLRRPVGFFKRLASQNSSIGVNRENLSREPETTFQLISGDRLVFFSDGVIRAKNEVQLTLGQNGLAEVAAQSFDINLFEMADKVLEQIAGYRHGPQKDDMTLILAEIK